MSAEKPEGPSTSEAAPAGPPSAPPVGFYPARLNRLVGILVIAAAVLFNEATLGLFVSQRTLTPWANRILLWGFDLGALALGILLVARKESRFLLPGVVLSTTCGLVLIVLAELGVRGLGVSAGVRELPILRPNPRGTGSHRLKPDLSLTPRFAGRTFEIRTNAHGMRGGEVVREAHPDKPRLAFLGDSFTFGCWATKEESSFAGVVAGVLGSRGIDVLNFGVGGYGFEDMELLLREEVLSFGPRYVVLATFNGNDFIETFLGLRRYDPAGLEAGVARLLSDVTHARVPEPYRGAEEAPSRWGKLVLYQFYRNAVDAWIRPASVRSFSINRNGMLSYSFWSQWPYPAVAERARDVVVETLGRIATLCGDKGIRLLIVSIPYEDQVRAPQLSGEGFDYRYPQKFIEEFASARSIPYLDLARELRQRKETLDGPLYLGTDPHFNDTGHGVAGWIMADFLLRHLP